jgi:hypothetical protein
MSSVNLEQCKNITEAGIRALSASSNLKKIEYRGYNWDNDKFFPLLAEENPQTRASLPKEKAALFDGKLDQVALNNLFKVPTLFCLAGFAAKQQLIKQCSNEFRLHLVEDNINLFLIRDMDPTLMHLKTIYLCNYNRDPYSNCYSNPGYQYQLRGEDGKLKRGIIYQKDLPGDFRYKNAEYVADNAQRCLPELLKHIIDNGHISLLSKGNTASVSNGVQETISRLKMI